MGERVPLQVGYWVVFHEVDTDTRVMPSGFFVDFERGKNFSKETSFRKNHLEPAWIYEDAYENKVGR